MSDSVEKQVVDIRMADGSRRSVTIEWWPDESRNPPGAIVAITSASLREEAKGSDFFEAFQKARRTFEADGARFLCYGASKGVWPSGMARSMAAGLKAYRLFEDRRPSMDDLVHIFAAGEGMTPSTVEEQADYAEAWFKNAVERNRRNRR